MIGVEWAVNIVVAHYIAYIADSKLRFDCIADRFSIREFVFYHLKMVILSQDTTNCHSRIEIVISENDLLFGHYLLIPCFSCALDHSVVQYRSKGKHDSIKGRIRFHRGHLFSQCDSVLAYAMIPSIIHSTSSCIC